MDPRRPYKLSNRIQRYAWGRFGKDSIIHRLLGTTESETLAAELWMGAHPSASSELVDAGERERLDAVIAAAPEEWLGKRVVEQFGATLPFLFKVLSIRTALSIQAHPDKKLAELLHERDPEHYRDSNHKPEMAIAVTDVEVLYGFRDLSGIRKYFSLYPALAGLLSSALQKRLLSDVGYSGDRELLRDICHEIFRAPEDKLRAALSEIGDQIRAQSTRGAEERWFLELAEHYPGDIGLVCLFLLNFISLKPGDALFVGPNVPHAYLRGDLLECMANSDNVVRAGLTNKFKDVQTLLDMLHFAPAAVELLSLKEAVSSSSAAYFSAPAKEFHVEVFTAAGEQNWELQSDSAAVLFCFDGRGKLQTGGERPEKVPFTAGESAFLSPHCFPAKLTTQGGTFYSVRVP